MLKKFIAIKNVGKFKNSVAPGPNPQLARYTLIVGANGFGKTTICTVLRSLQTGDASHILGRRTLGVDEAPTVELLLANGTARFDGTSWDVTYPGVAIFDGVFVADNVHSGEVVELGHKRNLYRVIIGDDGVKLANEEADLAAQSRTKTTEISAASRAIQSHIPQGMKLDAFVALPLTADIDNLIVKQERAVAAAKQSTLIQDRAALTKIPLAGLPGDFESLLSRTIDDLAEAAEVLLTQHFSAHGMSESGSAWVAEGVDHAKEDCPFCGQDIRGLPLIAAYRAIFSDRYKALVDDIDEMTVSIGAALGEAALAKLDVQSAQNVGAGEFWGAYCTLDAAALAMPKDLRAASEALAREADALLSRKASKPLGIVEAGDAFESAMAEYETAISLCALVNHAIDTANGLIATKKAEIAAGDVPHAEAELARLRATKLRHSPAVATLCSDYSTKTTAKDVIDKEKDAIRAQLDTHTKQVVKPYQERINHYLAAFSAGFTITETKHGYPGGIATSSYQLVINGTPVDVGDGNTPREERSFRNTLSAGDRTTLALAFFLAHLERDPAIGSKIVAFDDPFNSQDAFRRRQTVHEIMKVAGKAAQIVVLSHDATFLLQIWQKSPQAERLALNIADHRSQGSKLVPFNLEKACQARTAKDLDDLQTYLNSGAGEHLDIIRKMRVVLETHCRTTYPTSFAAEDWLGDIVRKVREDGEVHQAHALYDELGQINDYTKQYHHGEDVGDATPDQIDPTELTGFTRRTLKVANALQA
jgi:wobble nucleotide-excising tRNase